VSYRKGDALKIQPNSQLTRWARPFSKPNIARAARALAPTLLALSFAGVAHAQGTIDFSGAQTLMTSIKTFCVFAGAIVCFCGLVFAGIRMMSGNITQAIMGLGGAIVGAGVLGWGAGWISSLTGQSVS
jgi:hypothetical protein